MATQYRHRRLARFAAFPHDEGGSVAGDAAPLAGVAWLCRQGAALLDESDRAVVGNRDLLELVLLGLLADGHVLLDAVPGVAKTLIARSFDPTCALLLNRVQLTPVLEWL